MTIRVLMDQDLYDAAMKVMETLDERMSSKAADRKADEEVLGSKVTAEAYRRWQRVLISKYINTDQIVSAPSTPRQTRAELKKDPPVRRPPKKNEETVDTASAVQRPRSRRRPAKNHPWRTNPLKKPPG